MSQFLYGCAGAAAPEIIRWYRIARHATPAEARRPAYWIATVAYILLGGLWAYLVSKQEPFAAFASGIATEFAILALVQNSRDEGPRDPDLPEELTIDQPSRVTFAIHGLQQHARYLGRFHN
jgi:hypothetical protein